MGRTVRGESILFCGRKSIMKGERTVKEALFPEAEEGESLGLFYRSLAQCSGIFYPFVFCFH